MSGELTKIHISVDGPVITIEDTPLLTSLARTLCPDLDVVVSQLPASQQTRGGARLWINQEWPDEHVTPDTRRIFILVDALEAAIANRGQE